MTKSNQDSRIFQFTLGTIHKRRLLRGVGRWGPQKGDLRRRGVDTLVLVKETSFLMPKKLPRGDFNFQREN